jgi:hypothetical protein
MVASRPLASTTDRLRSLVQCHRGGCLRQPAVAVLPSAMDCPRRAGTQIRSLGSPMNSAETAFGSWCWLHLLTGVVRSPVSSQRRFGEGTSGYRLTRLAVLFNPVLQVLPCVMWLA